MAKKSKSSELERQFLADLKRIETDEANQARKSNQKRGNKKADNRPSKKNDLSNKSGRSRIPTGVKPVRQVEKLDVRKHVSKGKGKGGKRVSGSVEITRTKRTDQKIHLSFKNVRSVDNKIKLLNSEVVDRELTKQFKRKKGEPPLGMVVTVTDSQGRVHSDVAPYEMVINKTNAIDFATRFLNAMKANNIRWRERNRHLTKTEYKEALKQMNSKEKQNEEYDAINPDNAHTVTLKFIYAKNH